MFSGFFSKKTLEATEIVQPHKIDQRHETLHADNQPNPTTIEASPLSNIINKINKNEPTLKKKKYDNDDIEYLFIEENPFGIKQDRPVGSFGPLPMRTNSDKLLYGTGALYMIGLGSGGTYGFYRGLKTATGTSFKLRLNSILNQVTRYGPFAGNSMGVMAAGWATTDMALEAIRGKSDYTNHVSAAFLTGFLFKSTAGLRPAVLTGGLMAAVVGGYGLAFGAEKKEFKFLMQNESAFS